MIRDILNERPTYIQLKPNQLIISDHTYRDRCCHVHDVCSASGMYAHGHTVSMHDDIDERVQMLKCFEVSR